MDNQQPRSEQDKVQRLGKCRTSQANGGGNGEHLKKLDGDIVCACTKVQEVHKRTGWKVAIPIEHSKNIYGCILDIT